MPLARVGYRHTAECLLPGEGHLMSVDVLQYGSRPYNQRPKKYGDVDFKLGDVLS
ncbi:MAG: hypothetical protein WCE82_05295 [Halobacteriota archaeon]